jgi:hypothetical protein
MADPAEIRWRPDFDAVRHEYRWQGRVLPHVTEILKAANVRRPIPCDPATLRLAGWRGSLIHAATLQVDAGVSSDPLSPALAGYVEAYASFCSAHVFVASQTWSEQPLCDPALGIAGTPDRVGFVGEALHGAVLDLKTGEVEPSIGVQLAAYRCLLRANGMPVAHRLSVHLRPNGSFRVHEYLDSGDDATFLAAVTIHRWQQRTGVAA